MLTLKKVAVTGGLASGKSTVCLLLKELGAYVISADAIVHQLLSPNGAINKQVIQLLGAEAALDRKKIAQQVFSHPEKLRALENIIHPAVFEEIDNTYHQIEKENKYPLFVAEIPLLYEAHRESDYDAVISVTADPEICRMRFLKEGNNEEDFKQRVARQIDPAKKARLAHYVIKNNGSLSGLKEQVRQVYSLLTH